MLWLHSQDNLVIKAHMTYLVKSLPFLCQIYAHTMAAPWFKQWQ